MHLQMQGHNKAKYDGGPLGRLDNEELKKWLRRNYHRLRFRSSQSDKPVSSKLKINSAGPNGTYFLMSEI
jgi:hypothetical protein